MSFSSQVKEELCHLPVQNQCCVLAELAALMRACGTLEIGHGKHAAVRMDVENAAIARYVYGLVKRRYNVHSHMEARHHHRFSRALRYSLRIDAPDAAALLLSETGILVEELDSTLMGTEIPQVLLKKDCCRRSFVRGAFLGCGSVNNPEKGYHAEFVFRSGEWAKALTLILRGFDLSARETLRKDHPVVYMKESEHIVDLLNLMGAHAALLNMENTRVLKDIRNQVNRTVNCESANLDKTLFAAEQQLHSIEVIEAHGGLGQLPSELQELAATRRDNPDATLLELAEILGNVGKSGVNHRMRKIISIAKELEGGGET